MSDSDLVSRIAPTLHAIPPSSGSISCCWAEDRHITHVAEAVVADLQLTPQWIKHPNLESRGSSTYDSEVAEALDLDYRRWVSPWLRLPQAVSRER